MSGTVNISIVGSAAAAGLSHPRVRLRCSHYRQLWELIHARGRPEGILDDEMVEAGHRNSGPRAGAAPGAGAQPSGCTMRVCSWPAGNQRLRDTHPRKSM